MKDRMFFLSLMFGVMFVSDSSVPGLQADPLWNLLCPFFAPMSSWIRSSFLSTSGFNTRSKHELWHLIDYLRIWLSKFLSPGTHQCRFWYVIQVSFSRASSVPILIFYPSFVLPSLISTDSDMWLHVYGLFSSTRVILWPTFLIYLPLATFWRTSLMEKAHGGHKSASWTNT